MVTWSITPSSSSVPLQGKQPLSHCSPEWPPVGQAGLASRFSTHPQKPRPGLRCHMLPPSCGPQEAGGMTFIHKDQGTILRGKAADVLQGGDVTIHGEGSIGGHEAQPMFLQGRKNRRRVLW